MQKIIMLLCLIALVQAEDMKQSGSHQTKTSSCTQQEHKCGAMMDLQKRMRDREVEQQTKRQALPVPQLPESQSPE